MVNAISVRNCGYIRRLIRFKRVVITSGPLVYFVRFCARHGISGGDLVVNEIQHHCFGVCTGNKILCYGFSNYSLDVRIISFDVLRVFYTYKKRLAITPALLYIIGIVCFTFVGRGGSSRCGLVRICRLWLRR